MNTSHTVKAQTDNNFSIPIANLDYEESGSFATVINLNGDLAIYKVDKSAGFILFQELSKGEDCYILGAKFLDEETIVAVTLSGFLIIWTKKENPQDPSKIWSEIPGVEISQNSYVDAIAGFYDKNGGNSRYKVYAFNAGEILDISFNKLELEKSGGNPDCFNIIRKPYSGGGGATGEILFMSINVEYGVSVGTDNSIVIFNLLSLHKNVLPVKINNMIEVAITPVNSFDRTFIAVANTSKELIIIEVNPSTGTILKQHKFEFKASIDSIRWAKSGFSLSVLFDNSSYKAFSINQKCEFVEIGVEKVL